MVLTSRRRVIFPESKDLKARRESLPKFKPFELDQLAKRPPADNDPRDNSARIVGLLQQETNQQMLELLRRLRIDAAQSDAWRKGFYWLACYHHGVGRFVFYRPKKHRNAARWTNEHDLVLLSETIKLKATGLSELAALKIIASHPELKRLLPYRAQKYRALEDTRKTEHKKRVAALRRRLHDLKSKASEKSLLAQLLG
jgi:hypothetical protein